MTVYLSDGQERCVIHALMVSGDQAVNRVHLVSMGDVMARQVSVFDKFRCVPRVAL